MKVVPVGIGSLLPTGDICAAEPARRLLGRLAGGSRPGGSHRHQRAGIKGLTGTLAPPAGKEEGGKEKGWGHLAGSILPLPPPVPSPCTHTLGRPRGAAPGRPRQREAPGAPAMPYCSCNQPGLPQATVVLGAKRLSSAATEKGMPRDTFFSHFKAVNLAPRRGCSSFPSFCGTHSALSVVHGDAGLPPAPKST